MYIVCYVSLLMFALCQSAVASHTPHSPVKTKNLTETPDVDRSNQSDADIVMNRSDLCCILECKNQMDCKRVCMSKVTFPVTKETNSKCWCPQTASPLSECVFGESDPHRMTGSEMYDVDQSYDGHFVLHIWLCIEDQNDKLVFILSANYTTNKMSKTWDALICLRVGLIFFSLIKF